MNQSKCHVGKRDFDMIHSGRQNVKFRFTKPETKAWLDQQK